MAEWTKATVLKTVVLRTPVNEWLDPMKEAPLFEGAFLVSGTPHIGKAPGAGTGDGGGVLSRLAVTELAKLFKSVTIRHR